MESSLRSAYNAAYTPDLYRRYLGRLEARIGHPIPFRVAESPLFLPRPFRERISLFAHEIVDQLCDPALIARASKAIPPELHTPGQDALANCIQVDFAVCRDPQGQWTGQLVELQGFPSLYALIPLQAQVLADELRTLPGLDRPWTTLFAGRTLDQYAARLREALLGGYDPEEVVLLDLDPPSQKTYPDFIATQQLTGIEPVCPTSLIREGRRLFRKRGGKQVQVRRIFNRIVFDELERKQTPLPFRFSDDLEVSWFPHPNWYWIWSKFTLPLLDHPAIPRAQLLSELQETPEDLNNYVLKPLFSFAGTGVKVDVTRADLEAIPKEQRNQWLLQEKIHYADAFLTPQGHGVKAEIRMMFLRGSEEEKPELVMNLVRLSRGKMLGVDHNKDLDWVGGTVGIWPEDD
ncbi:MAG: hypothetical protein RMJ98_03910 [Myxococcales bacterium]|nr:hypothetical protein [Polyangiaceae bacterium]MDW8248434.1 hypothetical protein [Myxococcales bacterium]